MDIFAILALLGGLALFLYGMHVMSSGLEKVAGGRLEINLRKMTDKRLKGLAFGAGVTAVIQSSSAVTVMLVGLVNSGIMELRQTIGVIMGTNIGTTMTAWILSLAGINGDNVWIKLLKPENFSPIIAAVGIIMIMASKKTRFKDIGSICLGFAVLMYGMTLMGDAVSPLKESEEFASILTAFSNPILGVIVGFVFTGIIQSSSASVGILQALSLTGQITFGMSIPLIMGMNIGTCVTALLSSIGVNKNAKRVAVVHITFNIIGTIVCLILFYGSNLFLHYAFVDDAVSPVTIAIVHSTFNIFTTVVLLPFAGALERIAKIEVKDDKEEIKYSFIDERLLSSPPLAVAECSGMTVKMAELARDNVLSALKLLDNYDAKATELIQEQESMLDMYEDKIGTYLVKLARKELSDSDSRQISYMLHTIGNFERLGDHAVNILEAAQEQYDKKITFSDDAKRELHVLTSALREILTTAIDSFGKSDVLLASRVEPLEQVIDKLIERIKMNHIERLKNGFCTIELGFVLSDILTNCERVSDHCSNIAVAIIELAQDRFGTHEYLDSVKHSESGDFSDLYREYGKKYSF